MIIFDKLEKQLCKADRLLLRISSQQSEVTLSQYKGALEKSKSLLSKYLEEGGDPESWRSNAQTLLMWAQKHKCEDLMSLLAKSVEQKQKDRLEKLNFYLGSNFDVDSEPDLNSGLDLKQSVLHHYHHHKKNAKDHKRAVQRDNREAIEEGLSGFRMGAGY